MESKCDAPGAGSPLPCERTLRACHSLRSRAEGGEERVTEPWTVQGPPRRVEWGQGGFRSTVRFQQAAGQVGNLAREPRRRSIDGGENRCKCKALRP